MLKLDTRRHWGIITIIVSLLCPTAEQRPSPGTFTAHNPLHTRAQYFKKWSSSSRHRDLDLPGRLFKLVGAYLVGYLATWQPSPLRQHFSFGRCGSTYISDLSQGVQGVVPDPIHLNYCKNINTDVWGRLFQFYHAYLITLYIFVVVLFEYRLYNINIYTLNIGT